MKLLSNILFMVFLFTTFLAVADSQCGSFRLHAADTGWIEVNDEQVTSQKIRFFEQKDDWDNVKIDMGLMPAKDGNNYGFSYVKRDGKAFLNVQFLQFSADAPKIIGSYPCKKVDS